MTVTTTPAPFTTPMTATPNITTATALLTALQLLLVVVQTAPVTLVFCDTTAAAVVGCAMVEMKQRQAIPSEKRWKSAKPLEIPVKEVQASVPYLYAGSAVYRGRIQYSTASVLPLSPVQPVSTSITAAHLLLLAGSTFSPPPYPVVLSRFAFCTVGHLNSFMLKWVRNRSSRTPPHSHTSTTCRFFFACAIHLRYSRVHPSPVALTRHTYCILTLPLSTTLTHSYTISLLVDSWSPF
jgi:hypothetical protein